jgi:hypothetical protein
VDIEENLRKDDIIPSADFFLLCTPTGLAKNPPQGDTSHPKKPQVLRKYRRKKALSRMTKFAEFMATSLLHLRSPSNS